MSIFKDLTGKQFGRLTVLSLAGRRNGSTIWECNCSCGKIVEIPRFAWNDRLIRVLAFNIYLITKQGYLAQINANVQFTYLLIKKINKSPLCKY